MATAEENVALDANYFTLEIPDTDTTIWKSIDGVSILAPIQTSDLPAPTSGEGMRQRTRGQVTYAPISCTGGATADLALDEWMQAVIDSGLEGNTRDGTLTLYNAAKEATATWSLQAMIITQLSYSGMGVTAGGHLDVSAAFDCGTITREQ